MNVYLEQRCFILIGVKRVEKYFIRKKAFALRSNSSITLSEKLCKRMAHDIVRWTLLSWEPRTLKASVPDSFKLDTSLNGKYSCFCFWAHYYSTSTFKCISHMNIVLMWISMKLIAVFMYIVFTVTRDV